MHSTKPNQASIPTMTKNTTHHQIPSSSTTIVSKCLIHLDHKSNLKPRNSLFVTFQCCRVTTFKTVSCLLPHLLPSNTSFSLSNTLSPPLSLTSPLSPSLTTPSSSTPPQPLSDGGADEPK